MKKVNKVYSVRKEDLVVFFRLLLCFSLFLFVVSLLFPSFLFNNLYFYSSFIGVVYFVLLSVVKGYQKDLISNLIIVDIKNNIYFLIKNHYLILVIYLILAIISFIIMLFNFKYIDFYKEVTLCSRFSFTMFSINLLYVVTYFRDFLIYKRIKKYSKDFDGLINNKTILYKVYKVDVLKEKNKIFDIKYRNKVKKAIINKDYFEHKNLYRAFKNNINA